MKPRRLSICLVSEELPPETGWGGIGTYAWNLARGLARLDHRVHVIARTWGSETVGCVEGVIVHRLRVPEPTWACGTGWISWRLAMTRDVIFWNRKVASAVKAIAAGGGLDVIETPEFHAQGLVAGMQQHFVPLVVKLHTPSYLCRRINGVDFGASALDTRLGEAMERCLARLAWRVTSPSRAMLRDVGPRWRLAPGRVRVIANPIDAERFAPAGESPRQEVLYVGRLERRKGVETLARAWPIIARQHPSARLRLVGNDHESAEAGGSMKAQLLRWLGETDVADSVIFQGAVERTRLPAVYQAAQVCVVPSLYENFPYTCLEAMASGRAVVASDAGGIPEIVQHAADGLLVPPGDVDALAEAVIRLLGDAALRHRLGMAARKSVCQRFSVDAVCRQTADLYTSLSA